MLDRLALDDAELYCHVAGDGPAITFLHGFSGNHLSWWQQLPAFSDRYRCLAPDLRGFGVSAEEPGGPGVAAFVDDLVALFDHLGVARTVVVGHSMSGWPAASLATQHPALVDGLVLSGSPGGLLAPERHDALREAADDSPDADPLDRERAALSDLVSELNVHAPPEFAAVRPTLDELPIDRDRLADPGLPVLLVAGEADPFMPAPAVEAVRETLGGCAVAVVEGAGHSANFERPAAFNDRLRAFLGGLDGY